MVKRWPFRCEPHAGNPSRYHSTCASKQVSFRFDKLLNSGRSTTIANHALTVEYTSNPAWYAVQALPYLMEYPYECAEQTFNRYYANTPHRISAAPLPGSKLF